MSGFSVALLGAAGAVGREMWKLLEESSFPVSAIHAYTTERSAGTEYSFRGEAVRCKKLDEETFVPAQLVLASAGAATSREWLPRFAARGGVAVDNSSAFRTEPDCPLVVPEVNGHLLEQSASIIANPNCSTIQMVMVLEPLHREWGLRAVRVATYQAASGAGARAVSELLESSRAVLTESEFEPEIFPHPLGFNVIPQIGDFDSAGESFEEIKMRGETRRILDLPELPLSATCVRVPVVRGHSEAVWASFDRRPDPGRARELLDRDGIEVQDDPGASHYPLPRLASGRHEVLVGRIRQDGADPAGLAMWIVSDNLLKGAATNAVQIAESLLERGRLATQPES